MNNFNNFNNLDYKILRNSISFFHSFSVSILTYLYLLNYNVNIKNMICIFSSSYFISDIFYIIASKNYKKEAIYIYHHIVLLLTLNYINLNEDVEKYIDLIFIGELSNFFTYIVYKLIKTNFNKIIINIFKFIQFIWFLYFRGYILTYRTINHYPLIKSIIMKNLLLSIYFLGIMWIISQFKILCKLKINCI